MSNSNFENQIKQSVEQFDELPSDGVWNDLNQKLNQNPIMKNTYNQPMKLLSWVAGAALLVLGGYFFLQNSVEDNSPETSVAPNSPVLAKCIPEALESAIKQDKPVLLFLKNEACDFCEKFQKESLNDQKVREYLNENFVFKSINTDDKLYNELITTYKVSPAPSIAIFSKESSFSQELPGYRPPDKFLEYLKESVAYLEGFEPPSTEKSYDADLVHHYFKEELAEANLSSKRLAVYVCMEFCKPCKKFQNETLTDPTVSKILDENFVFVTVDLLNEDFKPFYKEYGVNASPMMLFFNNDGAFVEIIRGFRAADFFTEFLNEVIQKSGEIEPIETVEIPKESVATEVKIFPNPTNGPFTLQIKSEPVTTNLRMFDINGKEILFEDLKFFDDVYEQEFDLSDHPKGTYIFQVAQRGNLITEKVLIQ